MKEIRFTDTTFRDGNGSLWAQGMKTSMMLAVAANMDKAGFNVMEVIGNSYFKKCIRELKENPWERIRLLAKALPNTKMVSMSGPNPSSPFEIAPQALIRLHLQCLATNGIRRLHIMDPSNEMTGRLALAVQFAHEVGLEVAVALVFSLSPRHTDEYYAQKAKEAVGIGADLVYLKDPGGLLTPERARTIVPAILKSLEGVQLEFHTHCTTGLGPTTLLAAVEAGVDTVHTAVPPLANGSSQPSVFNVVSNLKALGYGTLINEEPLRQVSKELTSIAKREGLPTGQPLEYDYSQYIHQVPGGVISNLRHQLKQMQLGDRLPEVLEESVRVRQDLGYPIMVTPFSQFVVSQATMNVLTGKRYSLVTDEVIKYVLGTYGEEASNAVPDEIRDIILEHPRVKQLAHDTPPEPSLHEIRQSLGGTISDEELLLRYAVGGSTEVESMRMAEATTSTPSTVTVPTIKKLLAALDANDELRHVSLQRSGLSLKVSAAADETP